MLRINDLNFAIQGRPLFEGASATIPTGHKVGLMDADVYGPSIPTMLNMDMGQVLSWK